ncbi:helix-turn-helix transcriptional regulator [Leucobacter allii]|uniref:Helix-turn-helix transcriptional regulator n=1 Tax=Leucobacter allii TaxID=2932247 RepID=A0ABY4FPD6_9MICO|nr:helix-turn-helix transcriptional regulator [Leucobacter allii]UOQ58132.1 helix-turn-helix transcriptional regulator [Leucobacter allii]
MATIALRPGALDRVQAYSNITDDGAFARAIGVSPSTLHRAKTGQGESPRLIAGMAKAFGFSLGEIAIAVEEPESAESAQQHEAVAS